VASLAASYSAPSARHCSSTQGPRSSASSRGRSGLGFCDGLLHLLVEVGGGDLAFYLGLGSALVGLDEPVALVVFFLERAVLFVHHGEDLLHLFVAQAELLLESLDVAIVGEQE
jgi:hypothetical protein